METVSFVAATTLTSGEKAVDFDRPLVGDNKPVVGKKIRFADALWNIKSVVIKATDQSVVYNLERVALDGETITAHIKRQM